MLKNAVKKHPLQNRTNVQIKGGAGGVKGLLNNVKKKCTFLARTLPLLCPVQIAGQTPIATDFGQRQIFAENGKGVLCLRYDVHPLSVRSS